MALGIFWALSSHTRRPHLPKKQHPHRIQVQPALTPRQGLPLLYPDALPPLPYELPLGLPLRKWGAFEPQLASCGLQVLARSWGMQT